MHMWFGTTLRKFVVAAWFRNFYKFRAGRINVLPFTVDKCRSAKSSDNTYARPLRCLSLAECSEPRGAHDRSLINNNHVTRVQKTRREIQSSYRAAPARRRESIKFCGELIMRRLASMHVHTRKLLARISEFTYRIPRWFSISYEVFCENARYHLDFLRFRHLNQFVYADLPAAVLFSTSIFTRRR